MSAADRWSWLRPRNSRSGMRAKHGRSEAWVNYAERVTLNEFMRSVLYRRERGRCALCRRFFTADKYVVHHICYDHVCSLGRTVIQERPTSEHPLRTAVVPDCEACSAVSLDRFRQCMRRLAVVHPRCNRDLGG